MTTGSANAPGKPLKLADSVVPFKKKLKLLVRPVPMEMSEQERRRLKRLFRDARSMVEYGAGGSTRLAARYGLSIKSVESDPGWIERVREFDDIKKAERRGKLRIIHGDIGPVGPWGKPKDLTPRDGWLCYVNAPWPCDADLVLIDGRLRVACAAKAVLASKPSTKIVIHDFWSRPNYHAVLPMFEEIDRVNTMGVFKARADAAPIAEKLLASYRYVID